MKFIEREFPAMLPRFERLYARKYPPDATARKCRRWCGVLQERYGLRQARETRTRIRAASRPQADQPEQVGVRVLADPLTLGDVAERERPVAADELRGAGSTTISPSFDRRRRSASRPSSAR